MNPHIRRLYLAAIMDGVALLALFGIGLPLKYLADFPLAVSLLGPLHGVLFLWLVFNLFLAVTRGGLGKGMGMMMFVASLFPLGAFIADHQLKKAYGHAG